jgi:hypothetical protein
MCDATGKMTDEQAMNLMVNQTFQENEEATEKLQRVNCHPRSFPLTLPGTGVAAV